MQSAWPKGVNVIAIVPAFNEAGYIANVVKQLKQRKREGLIREIIVVDDGSRDRTGQNAKEAGADKVIRMRGNKGKMAAFAAGVKDVTARYAPKGKFSNERARLQKLNRTIVLSLDADLEKILPEQIKQLAEPIIANKKIDMVIGNTGGLTEISGQRAIRLRRLGGMLKGTRMWKTLVQTGYSQEIIFNRLIKNAKAVWTDFRENRDYREWGRRSKATQRLQIELGAGTLYLDERMILGKTLKRERESLAQQKLSKRERHLRARALLRQYHKAEREKARQTLQELRKRLKIIRQTKK
jgi:glycosyltransferase involved in cell wall biosynthesis